MTENISNIEKMTPSHDEMTCHDGSFSCDGVALTPKIIGITGGIGSGKSVVSRILRLKGFRVYDCDSEARRLMETHPDVISRIIGILGEEAYKASTPATAERNSAKRELDRAYVASRIFSDDGLRHKVNSVVHKAVADDFLDFARRWHAKGNWVFCETAILATSHMDEICDEIWLVSASEEERIARVMARNGISAEEVKLRMESQTLEFSLLPKGKICEIYNGDGDMLLPQIEKHIQDT